MTLLYAARNPEELAFLAELEELARRHHNLQIVCFAEDGKQWKGECGRICREKIEEHVPAVDQRRCYICGPAPFMSSMVEFLKEQRVPLENIKLEKF